MADPWRCKTAEGPEAAGKGTLAIDIDACGEPIAAPVACSIPYLRGLDHPNEPGERSGVDPQFLR